MYDVTIIGSTRVGAIAGEVTGNSTISSITIVDSSVTGSITVGGIIGRSSSNGTHEYLAYSGTVSGLIHSNSTGQNIGGVIGKMQNNTVLSKSYFNGNISGREDGGITGKSTSSSFIYDSYSLGFISGLNSGGIYGGSSSSIASNCFTSATISRTTGGYGALAGGSYGGQNNFYNSMGGIISTNFNHTTGKTTQQLKSKDTFSGWDFDNVWIISGNINDGFPFLRGNNELDLIDFTFIQDSSIGSLTFTTPLYSGTGTQSLQASDVLVSIYDPDGTVSLTSSNPLNFYVSSDNKSFIFGCSTVGIPSGNEELRIGPAYTGTNSSSSALSTTTIHSGGSAVDANRYLSINLVAPPAFTVSVTQEKRKKDLLLQDREWTYFVQNGYGTGRSRLYIDHREFSSQE